MSTAVKLSLDEFLARPEREDGQTEELIEGVLIVSPAAKVWHAEIVRRLRLSLFPLERDQHYVLANDFACILGDLSMPAPDLSAVHPSRWDKAVKNDGWLEGSPELVIEVASPSNHSLQRKAALYLEHGAEQIWIVNRKTRSVAVVSVDGKRDAQIGTALEFRGVSVEVASIFPNA